ncbi:hypothetical protein GF312_06140 [Candidatus Poribacteria bacterium]|nr:hypothetical protein [Candidatus Poribacteria bacterium]
MQKNADLQRISNMECSEVCKSLCAYVDGELNSDKIPDIEKHLNDCPVCRQELNFQKGIKNLLHKRIYYKSAPITLKQRIKFELERAEEYRESGIQALDLVRWGTHVAQLYKSKSDLLETMIPYVYQGLEDNELCICVTSDMTEEEVTETLISSIPDIRSYIQKGQLQIFSYEDWYLIKGCFDGQCSLSCGLKKYQEAINNGYSGLRITGNLSWLDSSEWKSFMEYENYMDEVVKDQKILIICAYKESDFTKNNVTDVINTHKYVISKEDEFWRLMKHS